MGVGNVVLQSSSHRVLDFFFLGLVGPTRVLISCKMADAEASGVVVFSMSRSAACFAVVGLEEQSLDVDIVQPASSAMSMEKKGNGPEELLVAIHRRPCATILVYIYIYYTHRHTDIKHGLLENHIIHTVFFI